jgi:hypothetical protein
LPYTPLSFLPFSFAGATVLLSFEERKHQVAREKMIPETKKGGRKRKESLESRKRKRSESERRSSSSSSSSFFFF